MHLCSSRTFILILLLLAFTPQTGWAKKMSRFQYGVDAVRVNPSPELMRWLDKNAPKGRENILIDYDNVQSDRPMSRIVSIAITQ